MRWWPGLMAVLALGCGGEKDPVVEALKEGGHTIVLRHATADGNSNQQEILGDCARQRNLTEAGEEQAAAIRRGIRELDIPIGDVRTSPMCRTRDTAVLAFGGAVDDEGLLSPGVTGTEADDRRRAAYLEERVSRPPRGGENTVLVTHTGNIGAALRQETVAEGEMLVYGEGGRLVGRIEADDWERLAG